MTNSGNAAVRRRQFDERAARDPKSHVSMPELGELVLINPLADETALLRELGVRPQECSKVDFYWKMHRDVALVQIWSHAYACGRDVGFYARREASDVYAWNFVAVVEEAAIDRAVLCRVLSRLVAFTPETIQLTDALQRIS